MKETDPCEICKSPAELLSTDGYDDISQRCPRCGDFKLTGTGMAVIRSVSSEDRPKLTGWVRNQNMLGELPELHRDRIRQIVATPIPGIVARADRLLSYVIKKQRSLDQKFTINDTALVGATYSKNEKQLEYIWKFLIEEGFLKHVSMDGITEITPSGHMRYEEITSRQPDSLQGFVAMWFDITMQNAYLHGFEPGVRNAGYVPVRVDSVEHIGKIDDEIVAQIRKSRFVVADFTGHRGGVYFEAGFALGFDLPVFWTCRKDAIDGLHFDIRQFNCIDWANPEELAIRLKNRIEAVIGTGPQNLI